jgi:hypothetical protein
MRMWGVGGTLRQHPRSLEVGWFDFLSHPARVMYHEVILSRGLTWSSLACTTNVVAEAQHADIGEVRVTVGEEGQHGTKPKSKNVAHTSRKAMQ